ncbi:MAG: hypothetical protein FWD06_03375 [Oscillospiraceae bacterium]|nr:hypothetical protein [Oscillospiraceae bacterium]
MKKCLSIVLAVLLLGGVFAVAASAQQAPAAATAQHGLYQSPTVDSRSPSPMERFLEFLRPIIDWMVSTLPNWLFNILDLFLSAVLILALVLLLPLWLPIEIIWRLVAR